MEFDPHKLPDIEEIGFDRPCSKEVHGSIHVIDIHIFVNTGIAHYNWPAKGMVTPWHQLVAETVKKNKADLPNVLVTVCDILPQVENTLDLMIFHRWNSNSGFGLFGITDEKAIQDQLVPFLQAMEENGDNISSPEAGDYIIPAQFELLKPVGLQFNKYIMTCAHVQRDSRCGYCGSILHDLFEEEIKKRDISANTKAVRIAHIGGHALAGNVLLYPLGIWYGYIRPTDVSSIFDSTLDQGIILKEKLRGKLGLSKSENLKLADVVSS